MNYVQYGSTRELILSKQCGPLVFTQSREMITQPGFSKSFLLLLPL